MCALYDTVLGPFHPDDNKHQTKRLYQSRVRVYDDLCYTSYTEQAGTRNSSTGPLRGIDLTTHCTLSRFSTITIHPDLRQLKSTPGKCFVNDTPNTFYLWLYEIGHMAKDHMGHSIRLVARVLKGSFICTI